MVTFRAFFLFIFSGGFMKILNLHIMFILMVVLLSCGITLAANSQDTTDNHVYATVDTAPGVDGYATGEVNIRKASDRSDRKVWFGITGTGTMTVTLQFKLQGQTTWTDYEDYTGNERKVVEGGAAGERWRGVVKNGNHTSGSKTFGLDW